MTGRLSHVQQLRPHSSNTHSQHCTNMLAINDHSLAQSTRHPPVKRDVSAAARWAVTARSLWCLRSLTGVRGCFVLRPRRPLAALDLGLDAASVSVMMWWRGVLFLLELATSSPRHKHMWLQQLHFKLYQSKLELQQRNQSHKNSMSHKTASRLQHVTSLESDLYIIASVTRYVATSAVKQWIVTLLTRKLWQPHFIQHCDPTVNKLLLNFITVFFTTFNQ